MYYPARKPTNQYIGERATKTLDKKECVQTSTAEGQLHLSQIKTLKSGPSAACPDRSEARLSAML